MTAGIREGRRGGAAALPVVLIIVGIVLEVIVGGAVVSSLLSSTMADEQASMAALGVARSGAEDAIVRINTYVDCPESSHCPATSTLTVGNGEACININETVADQELTIYSKGTVQDRERFIKAVVEISLPESSTKVSELKEVEDPGSGFIDCGT
jgi:hypothetical protein